MDPWATGGSLHPEPWASPEGEVHAVLALAQQHGADLRERARSHNGHAQGAFETGGERGGVARLARQSALRDRLPAAHAKTSQSDARGGQLARAQVDPV